MDIVNLISANRDYIYVVVLLLTWFNKKAAEVIAVIAIILQDVANNKDGSKAMNAAIALLRSKLPFLKVVPDMIIEWALQSIFNKIKGQSQKELLINKDWSGSQPS